MAEQGIAAPLPWQRAQWTRLLRRVAGGKLHHALLVSGPAGIGKRLLADRLGQMLLCARPGPEGACGECRSCGLWRAGTHPDCVRLGPEEAGRQIRIAQIRDELTGFLAHTTGIAARKLAVIDPAEAMNTATANCLLKSLEEPAGATHLLLLSDAPMRLLPTVRSRCEHLRLQPPPWEQGLAWLRSQRGVENAEDLLGAASGCPLGALRIAEAGGLRPFDRAAELLCRAVESPDHAPLLAGEWASEDPREVLGWVQLFLLDLGRWLADPRAARLPRALRHYERLRGRVDAAHVARCLQADFGAMRDAVSTANPNRQLLLEALLIRWSGAPGRAA